MRSIDALSIACLTACQWHVAEAAFRGSIGNVELGNWETSFEKAKKLTDSLTLKQKATVVTGGNVTSSDGTFFPGLVISDGQQGVINNYFVSGWPQPAAVAMTWDKKAIFEQGKAIGAEYKIRGVHVVDGPTSSPLGRVAWGGRQAESYAFDSYLNGIAMSESVAGELEAGVISSGKHFLLYEQETNRADDNFNSYNVKVDDKTLHETYLAPWYDAVHSGLGASMCAMNQVNGTYSCENESLLMGLLKDEVGFPGMVVPDIGSQKTIAGSANGGLDWTSDQRWTVDNLVDAVKSGNITEARLDDMVIRNVIGWYHVGADDGKFPSEASTGDYRPIPKAHRKLIRENGAKAMVLLKNADKALPLRSPRTMSVFGAHAGPNLYGPNEAFGIEPHNGSYYHGHLGTSSGAGSAPLPYLVTPYQALMERVPEDGTQFRYIFNSSLSGVQTGFVNSGPSTGTLPSIKNYAQFTEVCLVFINADGGEGGDRKDLRDPEQDNLVKTVAENCNNTIVVINAVGPRILDSWIESDNVTAVLYGGPLGQESGHSIVDVLYGDVNPSGALSYTIAKDEDDYPAKPCLTETCEYIEGNYIDYKHFDRKDIEPRYPFGHGLSYTTFKYSDLKIKSQGIEAGPATGKHAVGGRRDLHDEVVSVSVTVANTGDVDGDHVVQLYLIFPDKADQPIRQLRGFEKVSVKKGSKTKADIKLRRKDISYWDVASQEWTVAKGKYTINVGASSRDFRAKGTFKVD